MGHRVQLNRNQLFWRSLKWVVVHHECNSVTSISRIPKIICPTQLKTNVPTSFDSTPSHAEVHDVNIQGSSADTTMKLVSEVQWNPRESDCPTISQIDKVSMPNASKAQMPRIERAPQKARRKTARCSCYGDDMNENQLSQILHECNGDKLVDTENEVCW